jgi:hypothetical protein
MNTDQLAHAYGLCTQQDEFLEDKAIWIVKLSNGLTVYQDDNRPGLHESAWIRLVRYLESRLKIEKEPTSIDRLLFAFRSHVVPIGPQKAKGYYFSKGALRDSGWPHTKQCLVGGWLRDDNRVVCEWWDTPELLKGREVDKTMEECLNMEYPSLWINPSLTTPSDVV